MTDGKALKEIAYPNSHYEHPSHKNLEVYGGYVIRKNGVLKYVRHPLIDNYQHPSLLQSIEIPTSYIDIVKAAKAYRENRYDIKDDPDAEHLEWMLGLRKDYENKLVKSKKTGNPIVDVFQSELGDFVNSMSSPSISNWLEQISRDGDFSREEYKYLYSIQRHDDTSFDYIYLDQDGKSSYTVRKSCEWDYDISEINNFGSLTKLYDAVKNSIKYQLVETSVPVSIELYPKDDDNLIEEEAIFAYKFNNTYSYPGGWTGFKKSICQILQDSIIQHYNEKYGQDENYIHNQWLKNSLEGIAIQSSLYGNSLDSLYKSPIAYNPETGEVSLGEFVIDNAPDHLRNNLDLPALHINIAVRDDNITDLKITGPYSTQWNVVYVDLGSNLGFELNVEMLNNAIKQRIKLIPKKKGIISFMNFPVIAESYSTSVEHYLELLQDSINVYIKELEEELKEEGEDLYYLDRSRYYSLSELDEMPIYPGRNDFFKNGIIEYVRELVPVLHEKRGGYVEFQIDKYGKVCHVDAGLVYDEVLRKQIRNAFNTLPKLKPGEKNGVPVKCITNITFE